MMMNIGSVVADISDEFEQNQEEIKKEYIKININKFREIAGKMKFYRGNFGTGYPFYAIDKEFKETLPVIEEQIRYNHELRLVDKSRKIDAWPCEICLKLHGDKMPDLKQICKPCPAVIDGIKPRKVINRLPDLDMWLVCADGKLEESSKELEEMFQQTGFKTSDVDPVKTIKDMKKIVRALNNGDMPDLLLPIDAHIVEYSYLAECIDDVADAIKTGLMYGMVPYVPIHPLSLRKTWQKDDEAYNFVHDFLSSFTEADFENRLKLSLDIARKKLVSKYTDEELYDILLMTGTESTLRRQKSPVLQKRFKERVKSWRN